MPKHLLLDIGNTNIKWCLLLDGTLTASNNLAYNDIVDSWPQELNRLWYNLPIPKKVHIGSVANISINTQVKQLVWRLWQIHPIFYSPSHGVAGLELAYSDPHRLGVDRWLSLLAACVRFPQQMLMIVDCGSAITLDVLISNGSSQTRHLGGMILPGIHMQHHAIFNGTNITPGQIVNTPNWLGKDTNECIASGVLQAIIGLIERVQRQLTNIYGSTPQLILTGGDANQITDQLTISYLLVPELIFEGLALLTTFEP